MAKLICLSLAVLMATAGCTYPNAFSAEGRQYYRANICQQYLSPESITPNLSGRGRSCVVNAHDK